MLVQHDVLSYADLSVLVGRSFSVDRGIEPTVDLVLETLSTPWRWEEQLSYSLLFTGPVDGELLDGDHYVRHGDVTLRLTLEPVGADVRFVLYEAFVVETLAVERFALAV